MSRNQRVYPTLGEDAVRRLEAIQKLASDDPGYFDDEKCPYKWLKPWIVRGNNGGGGGGKVKGERIREAVQDKIFSSEQKQGEAVDAVLTEVEDTIEEMKELGNDLYNGTDTNDKLAFFKAKTTLLEKWTTLKSKLIDMKQMSEFQQIVIGVMDEVLTLDQQQDFKKRLKKVGL